jgi:serine/threonine protein kinase
VHRIGDIIDERYQLIRPLGIRQHAEWWEAEHQVVGRRVTLKLLHGDLADDPEVQQRLALESRAASEIRHPTAIEVFDVGVATDGEAFLVTEPLRGEMLSDIIARAGSLTPGDACRVAIEILGGLEAAHAAGIAHGSLTPSTVILRRDEDGKLVVKILDFGLDTCASAPACDVVAAGAILDQMLSKADALPADLARIVGRARGAPPTERFADAKELADHLAPFAAPPNQSAIVPRNSLMPFLSPEARRSRAMARIDKAVLGDHERAERSSGGSNLVLLTPPTIPRAPRAPEHFASQNEPRRPTSVASTGWTAGLLAAGVAAGLLLARLLHL